MKIETLIVKQIPTNKCLLYRGKGTSLQGLQVLQVLNIIWNIHNVIQISQLQTIDNTKVSKCLLTAEQNKFQFYLKIDFSRNLQTSIQTSESKIRNGWCTASEERNKFGPGERGTRRRTGRQRGSQRTNEALDKPGKCGGKDAYSGSGVTSK